MYYQQYASRLADAGYEPIPCDGKRPVLSDWVNTPLDLVAWSHQHAGCNIGIRNTPAFDIDVTDPEFCAQVRTILAEYIDPLCVRIGAAPKFLVPFQGNFRKRRLALGPHGAVELLGKGQQWIAVGKHPGTGKPYHWEGSLLDADLQTLSSDTVDEIFARIEAAAAERGWQGKTHTLAPVSDLPAPAVDLTDEEIREAVSRLDPDCEYDQWTQVGMALYSQYMGGDRGLEIWDEWSAKGGKYAGTCEAKWRTFSVAGVGFATVLKLAAEAAMVSAKADLEAAGSAEERKEALKAYVGLPYVGHAWEERLIAESSATATTVKSAKKRAGEERAAASGVPAWAEGWIYVTESEAFYREGRKVGVRSFDLTVAEQVKQWAKKIGLEQMRAPSWEALERGFVPIAQRLQYLPGQDRMAGGCLNTWSPPVRGSASPEQMRDIATLVEFVFHEYAWVYNSFGAWLAHHPERPIRWVLMVIGPGGEGKSTLNHVLQGAVGVDNAVEVAPSDFQRGWWADNRSLACIEEVHCHGWDRVEVYNSMKALVSNSRVRVRRLYQEAEYLANRCSYFATSNYRDCLPLVRKERRFSVVFTPYDSREEVDLVADPRLFKRIHSYPPETFRDYFMRQDIDPRFDPYVAVETPYAERMAAQDLAIYHGVEADIGELIADPDFDLANEEWVCTSAVASALDCDIRRLTRPLSNLGYVKSARIWVDGCKLRVRKK